MLTRKDYHFIGKFCPEALPILQRSHGCSNALKNKFKLDNLKNITFVFDRGMVSDDNLDFLETNEIKYISAMDRNQIEGITKIKFDQFADLLPEKINEQAPKLKGFKKINDNTYAREIKTIGMRRYILCFNPQLFKDQRKARKQALVDFNTFVNELNKELLDAKNSRKRPSTSSKFKKRLEKIKLNGFVKITLNKKYVHKTENGTYRKIQTYQGKVVVDEKGMRMAGKKDGFWLLVTSHSEKLGKAFKLNTEEAIAPVIILSRLRSLKGSLGLRPNYHQKEDRVDGHVLITVLAHHHCVT